MIHTQHADMSADTIDLNHLSQVLTVAFARECGFRPLPWMQRGFYRLLDEGFEYDMLLNVIEQTSKAPRPSWAYLSAIVNRARSNGAYTYLEFFAQPRQKNDPKYKEAHFFDNISPDALDEAIRVFDHDWIT